MTSNFPSLLRLAVIALVAGTALATAGCGRKGEPELASADKPKVDRPVGIPVGAIDPAPKPAKPAKKPFLLDPLL